MGYDDVREQLMGIMERVDGLHSIVFTDRDGVPIVKVTAPNVSDKSIKPEFLANSISAMTQAARLGMGKANRMVVCFVDNQVICFAKNQVTVHLYASSAATTGMLLNLEEELSALAEDLGRVIETS